MTNALPCGIDDADDGVRDGPSSSAPMRTTEPPAGARLDPTHDLACERPQLLPTIA